MDYTTQLFLEFALAGVLYFLIYRFYFFKHLKWKMLHSIWLPLVFSLLVSAFAIILIVSPSGAGSWNDLAGAAILLVFNIPVVTFFILFAIVMYFDKKAKV